MSPQSILANHGIIEPGWVFSFGVDWLLLLVV